MVVINHVAGSLRSVFLAIQPFGSTSERFYLDRSTQDFYAILPMKLMILGRFLVPIDRKGTTSHLHIKRFSCHDQFHEGKL